MKLTTYTDFGIRTLMYLATLPEGERSSSADIANIYQASRNHIAKVIAHLSSLNYISSSRGKNGGVWLTTDPADINIGKLIRELESNLDGVDCESTDCCLIPACNLRKALGTGVEAFLTAMDEYNLSDLLSNKDELEALWYVELV